MKRGREHFKKKVSHGRYVKVYSQPNTWLEVGDETSDELARERYQYRLQQQQARDTSPPPVALSKMKNINTGDWV